MVKIALQIKATLENIESFKANKSFNYFLKLQCVNCGEISEKWHDVNENQTFAAKTTKSDVHYMSKCKLCSRENTLDIIPISKGEYTNADQNKFKTLVIFDCRGIEPIDFSPRDGWIAVCEESGKTFEDVDLTEKEWVDYDDDKKQSVGIYDLEWKFVKQK